MHKFLLRRFMNMIVTLFIISMLSFVVIQLPPGDFVSDIVAKLTQTGGKEISPEFELQMRELYGLNEPVYVQYMKWMKNIITKGEFGYSHIYRRDASEIIFERMPLTLLITGLAVIFIWVTSLPIGVYTAVKQYSVADYFFTFLGFIGLATPNFLLALIFMYVGYEYFGLSIIGMYSQEYIDAPMSWAKAWDLMKHIWIPVLIIGTAGMAGLIRTMRANLLDELRKPYVETARAKGLSETRILWKYPVRHALNPFISTIGLTLPFLVSGEALTSIVLNLPTSGPVILDSLLKQDMYVASGFILMLSVLTVAGMFLSDVALAMLDPRIRLE